MLMLALRRNLLSYREDVNRGEWQKAEQFCLLHYPIRDLFGARLGVVGHGSLGKAVGQLARAIGMEVLIAERKQAVTVREGRVPFNEVLRLSDVVSLHCPLNDETRNLIAEPELRAMKREALLINTARGGLVNEDDLWKALNENVIAGAAVDVHSTEPPPEGNVLLTASLPNLIITPHIAWASEQAVAILADQLIDNLEAFVNSESRNRVV
jgi:glycerate dehydrogenase